MGGARGAALATALSLAIGLLTNLASATIGMDRPWRVTAAWLVLALLAVVALVVQLRREPSAIEPPDHDFLESVARSVRNRWEVMERQRGINEPLPLPVRWHNAPGEAMDHWPNVLRAASGVRADPLDLAGELDDIAEVYRQIPSGRLVILGAAGSGKSVLAGRLALRLLEARLPPDAVPVVVSLASWIPPVDNTVEYGRRRELTRWLAEQLARDHPALAAPDGSGPSAAAELVEQGRVLPILDGFDELPAGLRVPALRALGASGLPLILTSRLEEYEGAAAATAPLARAAAVVLEPLTSEDLRRHLPRTGRTAVPPGDGWDAVLSILDRPEHRPLRRALTSPLNAHMAATAYGAGLRIPSELLDRVTFPSVRSIERHLFAAYLPAVYSDPSARWPVLPAQRWLADLARNGEPSLEWWRMRHLASLPAIAALAFTATAVVTAMLGVIVAGQPGMPSPLMLALGNGIPVAVLVVFAARADRDPQPVPVGMGRRFGRYCAVGIAGAFVGGLVREVAEALGERAGRSGLEILVNSAGFAVATGTILGLGVAFTGPRMRPTAVRLSVQSWPGRMMGGLLGGATIGLASALCCALVVVVLAHLREAVPGATVPDLMAGPRLWRIGAIYTCMTGVILGSACGIALSLRVPLGVDTDVTPLTSLRLSRSEALFRSTVFAAMTVGLFGAMVVSRRGAGPGLASVVGDSLTLAIVLAISTTAWGNWLLAVRFWLPITGRLPWRVSSFLEDACKRGVLRRSGAGYVFRHALLREHLADSPAPPPNSFVETTARTDSLMGAARPHSW